MYDPVLTGQLPPLLSILSLHGCCVPSGCGGLQVAGEVEVGEVEVGEVEVGEVEVGEVEVGEVSGGRAGDFQSWLCRGSPRFNVHNKTRYHPPFTWWSSVSRSRSRSRRCSRSSNSIDGPAPARPDSVS